MNITIDVNLNAPDLVTVLQNLVSIVGTAPVANNQRLKVNKQVVEAKQKEEKEVEDPDAKQAAVEDDSEQSEQQNGQEESETSITIVDIRNLVSKAAKKDRTAVKNLLKEFGADNASALDKKHYEAFSAKVKELI